MSAHKKRKPSLIVDAYYTMFLLCRHLTYDEGDTEVQIASILVSIVDGFFVLALYCRAQLLFELPLIGRWLVLPLSSLFLLNHYLFVRKDRGNEFSDKFSEYSEFKQAMLYVAAVAIVLTILVVAFFSFVDYREAHRHR